MTTPLRLNPDLVAAAERAAMIQKRSVPKQIEFWATLGKALENVLEYSDIFAVLQGLKKISVEPVPTAAVQTDDVFSALEKARDEGALSRNVTGADVYYEASPTHQGLIDQVNSATGERLTGQFSKGEFEALQG